MKTGDNEPPQQFGVVVEPSNSIPSTINPQRTSGSPRRKRTWPLPSWLLALTPTLLLLLLIGLTLQVRLGVGHWPQPLIEKYNTSAFKRNLVIFAGVAVFTIYAAPALWLVCVCLPLFRLSFKTHMIQAALYVAGWGLIAGYWALDPGRFITWLLD